jgi:hypothetical protein
MAAAYSADELEAAFRTYWQTGAVGEDWDAWADLFTEDVEYVEHQLGNRRGREAVREWIVPLMVQYPELYTAYEWHMVAPARGRVVFAMQNRRDHPNGVDLIDFSGLSIIDYAGDGRWCRQEDYWAVDAGQRAFVSYRKAVKALDPDHPGRATRRDWGSGPAWCQGPPVNERLRRV